MENQLRVREVGQNIAGHKNIDISSGQNASVRGMVKPDYIKEVNPQKFILMTFVHDTIHNRAYFLQRPDIEIAELKNGRWEKLSKSLLEEYFQPAFDPEAVAESPEPEPITEPDKKEPTSTIQGIKDFEHLPKVNQGRALNSLMSADAVSQDFKTKLLNDIILSSNPNIANTVKEKAETMLKQMAKG